MREGIGGGQPQHESDQTGFDRCQDPSKRSWMPRANMTTSVPNGGFGPKATTAKLRAAHVSRRCASKRNTTAIKEPDYLCSLRGRLRASLASISALVTVVPAVSPAQTPVMPKFHASLSHQPRGAPINQ